MAERIIRYSDISNLKQNLEEIHGRDIDSLAIAKCKQNLDSLIKDYNISVEWNVKTCDALKEAHYANFSENQCSMGFDFIVGNPHYIGIQNMGSTGENLQDRIIVSVNMVLLICILLF